MSASLVYFMAVQLLAAVVAWTDIYWDRYTPDLSRYSSLQHLLAFLDQIGMLRIRKQNYHFPIKFGSAINFCTSLF